MSENRNGDEEFRRLLWFLLGGSRGGENRVRILNALRARPNNLNQLSRLLEIDYRSVQHHMRVLLKNSLVVGSGERYGVVYSIHPWLDYHLATFEQVCQKLGYPVSTSEIAPSKSTRHSKRKVGAIVMPQILPASDALHL
jgi:DNA-binding transcriptional ArsR family regulator